MKVEGFARLKDVRSNDELVLVVEESHGLEPWQETSSDAIELRSFVKKMMQACEVLKNLHDSGSGVGRMNLDCFLFATGENQEVCFRISPDYFHFNEGQEPLHSLRFAPPELIAGLAIENQQSFEIYSLGLIFYEWISGQQAFLGENLKTLASQIYSKSPIELMGYRGIPRILDSLIQRMIRKSTRERYQSYEGLQYDLEALLKKIGDSDGEDIQGFALGRQDHSRELNYDIAMVGRKAELEALKKRLEFYP